MEWNNDSFFAPSGVLQSSTSIKRKAEEAVHGKDKKGKPGVTVKKGSFGGKKR